MTEFLFVNDLIDVSAIGKIFRPLHQSVGRSCQRQSLLRLRRHRRQYVFAQKMRKLLSFCFSCPKFCFNVVQLWLACRKGGAASLRREPFGRLGNLSTVAMAASTNDSIGEMFVDQMTWSIKYCIGQTSVGEVVFDEKTWRRRKI